MKNNHFEDIETEHPWQETPTKLIMYAIDLAENGGEFLRHVSFLLLDVGIETLFNAFLSIDSSISKSKNEHKESKKLIKGESFFTFCLPLEALSKI